MNTTEYLKKNFQSSNTRELLLTDYNYHPSVIEFELCWARIMGDEPVRELVERIIFFAGGMRASSSIGIGDFIINHNFKTHDLRRDLFFTYSGHAEHLSKMTQFADKGHKQRLITEEGGNVSYLMSNLNEAVKVVEEKFRIRRHIEDLDWKFLELDLYEYYHLFSPIRRFDGNFPQRYCKDFYNAIIEFNNLSERSDNEDFVMVSSWRNINLDVERETTRIDRILRFMIFNMVYKYCYDGTLNQHTKSDAHSLASEVYDIWHIDKKSSITKKRVEREIHQNMIKYELSKDMKKWYMITRDRYTTNEKRNFDKYVAKIEKKSWILSELTNDCMVDFRHNAYVEGRYEDAQSYYSSSKKEDVIVSIQNYNQQIRNFFGVGGGSNYSSRFEIQYNKSWDKKRLIQAWMSEGETERHHDWKVRFNRVIKLLNERIMKEGSFKKFKKWRKIGKTIDYVSYLVMPRKTLVEPLSSAKSVIMLRNNTKDKIEYSKDKNYLSEN